MFEDIHFYEAKVFLRSLKDSIDCIKYLLLQYWFLRKFRESAEIKQSLEKYTTMMERLTEATKNNEVLAYILASMVLDNNQRRRHRKREKFCKYKRKKIG